MMQLRDYQSTLVRQTYEAWQAGQRNVLLVSPTGSGKCHGRDTPILMFDGTIKMVQDVQFGDFLMGPDSKPRFVVGTTSGVDDLYQVTPVKGDPYVVNSQHVLSLRRTNTVPNDPRGGEIVNIPVLEYLAQNKTFKHIHKGWRTGVDFTPGPPLRIDPYFLGLWLGDGTATGPSVTTMDIEVIAEFYRYAMKFGLTVRIDTKPNNRAITLHMVRVKNAGIPQENPVTGLLRSYNLTSNKHIPHDYLTASREDRLALLAGILDSDGHLSHNGYDLTFKIEKLLEQTVFLARSLGLSAYKVQTEKTCTNNGVTGTYYRCNINGNTKIIPCRVARQKARERGQIKNVLNTGIKVDYIGPGPFYGFQVAGPDHLYMLGDFTVTHNSVIFSQVVLDRDKMGANQCVMAHRTELVSQMSVHIAKRGVKHRIIAPTEVVRRITNLHREVFNGQSFINPDARCAVAAAQTLDARADSLRQWGAQVHNWILDEAHHLTLNGVWHRGIQLFPNALGLGVTATPARADGLGLGRHTDGLMDVMFLGPTYRQLIDERSLVDFEIALPQSDFNIGDDALTPTGDYSRTKMRDATKKSHLVGDVVEQYSKRAWGRRAICFATDVESSNEIAARFNAAGIPAASVSAKTDSTLRDQYMRDFKSGKIWVLVNVDLYDEGVDVEGCDVVIMARPTASLGKYMQQIGRCLRLDPNNPSKVALIIDHVSNVIRHGLPDKPRQWTLDRREKRAKRERDPEEIDLTACRECSRPYERCLPACPYCGYAPPLAEPGRRTIEQVDGDLTLLDLAALARLRAQAEIEAPASVYERVQQAAGPLAGKGAYNRAVERLQSRQVAEDAIAQWAAIQRAKGRTDSEIMRRFYLTTGSDVVSALGGDRQQLDALAERIRGWYQG